MHRQAMENNFLRGRDEEIVGVQGMNVTPLRRGLANVPRRLLIQDFDTVSTLVYIH